MTVSVPSPPIRPRYRRKVAASVLINPAHRTKLIARRLISGLAPLPPLRRRPRRLRLFRRGRVFSRLTGRHTGPTRLRSGRESHRRMLIWRRRFRRRMALLVARVSRRVLRFRRRRRTPLPFRRKIVVTRFAPWRRRTSPLRRRVRLASWRPSPLLLLAVLHLVLRLVVLPVLSGSGELL